MIKVTRTKASREGPVEERAAAIQKRFLRNAMQYAAASLRCDTNRGVVELIFNYSNLDQQGIHKDQS